MFSEENLCTEPTTVCRPPRMTRLEDQNVPEHQLRAALQDTKLDHDMVLDVHSSPNAAKLTGIMVTLDNTCSYCVVDASIFLYISFVAPALGERNSHPAGVVDVVMAGANIVRLNLSHKDDKWHVISVQSIREAGNRIYKSCCEVYPLGVAMDLCGPEIRTGLFYGDENSMGYAKFEKYASVRIHTDESVKRAGTSSCFWVSYPDLPRVCLVGDRIVIDRGALVLDVTCIGQCSIVCEVVKGGVVKNSKLVQLIHCTFELPLISEEDDEHINLALKLESDFIIVNRARNSKMVKRVKCRIEETGPYSPCVLAKICSQQGLENFNEILKAADGIIFDRSSVEVDVKPEKLFLAQKSVIAKCNTVGKPVTLMFHVNDDNPTIEMDHIVNAVLEGVDTILLATGDLDLKQTCKLIKKMNLACREAECARWQKQIFNELSHRIRIPVDPIHSIAIGAVETSLKSNAAAIVITTTSGRSAMMVSIYRPRCPIVAVTRHGVVARWLQLYFGVHPFHYRDPPHVDWGKDIEMRIRSGINYLWTRKYIAFGDPIVVMSGCQQGTGYTNCIRIVYVPCDGPSIDNFHTED